MTAAAAVAAGTVATTTTRNDELSVHTRVVRTLACDLDYRNTKSTGKGDPRGGSVSELKGEKPLLPAPAGVLVSQAFSSPRLHAAAPRRWLCEHILR
jgi:hypothetical protein